MPQELGDFGVLLHSECGRGRALLFNALSGMRFLLGGLLANAASSRLDVSFLVPFAAGNFLDIGASDLIPEVNKHHGILLNVTHFLACIGGLGLLLALRLAFN